MRTTASAQLANEVSSIINPKINFAQEVLNQIFPLIRRQELDKIIYYFTFRNHEQFIAIKELDLSYKTIYPE